MSLKAYLQVEFSCPSWHSVGLPKALPEVLEEISWILSQYLRNFRTVLLNLSMLQHNSAVILPRTAVIHPDPA